MLASKAVLGMVEPGASAPTARRMLVGAQLRRLRIRKGVSREQAGEAIRASAYKIHRLENGQVSFKQRDIVDLLHLYGVTDPGATEPILALAREANIPNWWRAYADVLPSWFRSYVDLESAASLIRIYESQLVPGLLQTEDYLREVMRGAQLTDSKDRIERRVQLRLTRQQLLTRDDPPQLWAVLDEAALRRPVGGRSVMHAQLNRLIEATNLPNVTLQVLPLETGAHPAMQGAFSILRFPGEYLPDVVYIEHRTNGLYLTEIEEVDHFRYTMDSLGALSVKPDKTVDFLEGLVEEFEH